MLGLAAFLVVAVISFSNGEELIWVVGKALACFFICWFVMGYLGNVMIGLVVPEELRAKIDAEAGFKEEEDNKKKNKKPEKDVEENTAQDGEMNEADDNSSQEAA